MSLGNPFDHGNAPALPAIPEALRLDVPGPGVHQLTVVMPSGESLRYTVSVPAGYDGTHPTPLAMALHFAYVGEPTPFYGRRMLDSFVTVGLRELEPIIVAPDALDGGNWQSARNEQAVVWLTRCALQTFAIDPKRVLLLGFSMGGKGAWYIGGRHQDLFTAAVPIAGSPDDVVGVWRIPVYVIHAAKDEILPWGPTQDHVERLKARGADVELRVLDDVTHYQVGRYARPLREALPWLRERWG